MLPTVIIGKRSRATDRNLYILGAGFSVDAGFPTIPDFLNQMRDAAEWLAVNHRDEERDAVERVLEFRHEAAAAGYRIRVDLDNIEDLFSLAAAMPERKFSADVQSAIGATLNYRHESERPREGRMRVSNERGWKTSGSWRALANRVTDAGGDNVQDVHSSVYDLYAATIAGMISQTPGRNVAITFNYDLLLEDAMWRLGLPFSYGLGDRGVTYDDHGRSQPALSSDGLQLLKLHGSLNWGMREGILIVHDTYDRAKSACQYPHLVPPTWEKAMTEATRTVWEHAVTALGQATRIIVIGLSFRETDAHLKYLLAAGLMNNSALRRVIIVNPQATKLVAAVQSVFRSDQIDYGLVEFCDLEVGAYFTDEKELDRIGRPIRHRGLDLLEIRPMPYILRR